MHALFKFARRRTLWLVVIMFASLIDPGSHSYPRNVEAMSANINGVGLVKFTEYLFTL